MKELADKMSATNKRAREASKAVTKYRKKASTTEKLSQGHHNKLVSTLKQCGKLKTKLRRQQNCVVTWMKN